MCCSENNVKNWNLSVLKRFTMQREKSGVGVGVGGKSCNIRNDGGRAGWAERDGRREVG